MLFTAIIIYLAVTVAIGAGSALLVRNRQDFLLAGRKLPLGVEAATLFATWFGAETVLGASSTMAEKGLSGVVEDPFGAALCLILVGAFFARPLYRMNILTFGDFYLQRYGKAVEIIASIFLILSYIGWIAAQMLAIGLILHIVNADISMGTGIWVGSSIVVLYTFLGGMWSVSITDLLQSVLILAGLFFALEQLTNVAPIKEVIRDTPDEYFTFFEYTGGASFFDHIAAWITIGLGSIPQQDVFQRVMSAKSEKVAVRASYWAAGSYLTIALIPLLLALYAMHLHINPAGGNGQLLLPTLISTHTSLWVQILFFGALLSAIMSTSSGALLAPSAILSENIIGHFLPTASEKARLWLSRFSVIIIAAISIALAFRQGNIYELVGASSALSLVALFVPLVAGIYIRKANTAGALLSILLGMAVWLIALWIGTEVNAIMYGLGASILGMVVGMWGIRSADHFSKSLSKFS